MSRKKRPMEERFWEKVQKTDGCWIWTAGTDTSGYGLFTIDHENYGAHRVAYEMLVGPIPVGLCLDHLCRNKRCVNPQHLDPVTHKENVRRGASLGRTDMYGEANPFVKFSDAEVAEIRRIYSLGGYSYKKLSSMFHISVSQICNIINERQRAQGSSSSKCCLR